MIALKKRPAQQADPDAGLPDLPSGSPVQETPGDQEATQGAPATTDPCPEKSSSSSGPGSSTPATDWNQVEVKFKRKGFVHSALKAGSKKHRQWRGLKQIISFEQQQQLLNLDGPEGRRMPGLYWNVDAPPSFKPSKKYSDLSGLEAKYTDPQTKLHFFDGDEFKAIRKLPSNVVANFLALRKANVQLQ